MRREATICLGLAAVTLALFYPVSRHEFINLDDPDYVTQNPVVQAGLTWAGLGWAFGASHANNWHPLTWLSHMTDCQCFGLKAGAHHGVSLGLHLASTVLLFLVLRRLTGAVWRSALVAALFGWHPLHVESVAWVAERKDVLSACFFMLTLLAYVRYVEGRRLEAAGGSESPALRATRQATGLLASSVGRARPLGYYLLSLLLFACGLMSKPMVVTLPLLLLLLDYWPLSRFELATRHSPLKTLLPLVLEKVPFFALALAAGVVTLLAQRASGAVESLDQLPLASRLANALAAYSAYLGQMFWPMNLSVFYPHLPVPPWQVVSSTLLWACLTVLCLRQARPRPWLLVGWAWFCVMLLPVIGLVQVGWQARADRYTYLPLIGAFIMLAWGVAEFFPRSRACRLCPILGAALVLGACLAVTRLQLKHWQNSVALFSHALKVTSGNWLAHNNLGTALAEQGKMDEAVEHFRAALQLNPAYDDALNNLGRFLAEQGKWDEAQTRLAALVRRNPRHAGAHRNLGHVLLAEGAAADGVAQYALARQLQPDDPTTPEDLAAVLAQPAESQLAPPYLRQALELLPTAEMRARVAGAWAGQGKLPSAVQGYRAALALQPQSPELLNNLAWLLATCPVANVRDGTEAVRLGERACELTRFKRPLMVGTLAAAYAEAGRFAEAVATARQAGALAAESGDGALAAKNQALLELYRAGRPYREAPNPAPAGSATPNP